MRTLKSIFLIVINNNNRILVHVGFWLAYYLFRVQLYIDIYPHTPLVQMVETLCMVPVVYFNFYVLLPKFLKRRKSLAFALLLITAILLTMVMLTESVRMMMRIGIYTENYPSLYTPWKMTAMISRIAGFVLITSAIKILKEAYLNQQVNQNLVKDKLENELKYLKAQINPHFFLNTLNNLYALVKRKSDEAPELILKLSDLMKYLLYETNKDLVALNKEVEMIISYIELEKLRFGDELNVLLNLDGEFEHKQIAPMLLIPVIENSFKHSISSDVSDIWVKINVGLVGEKLIVKVENNLGDAKLIESGGIGLSNIRRRLELIYKDHFELKESIREDSFCIELSIELDKTNYLLSA